MEHIKELDKFNAKYIENNNKVEIYFGKKTNFIKHKIELSDLKTEFDEDKQCFILNSAKVNEFNEFVERIVNRPTIIFDMDGVLIDTTNSFSVVTMITYNHFTNQELTREEINSIKYKGGFNSDFDILMYLFKERGFKVDFEEMKTYYLNLYFDGTSGYIDKEKNIITEQICRELMKKYNLAIFTGRDVKSTFYTLKIWNVLKYFYPIITFQNVGWDHQKPDTKGVSLIKEEVISEELYYLGDTVDDMICARNSNVKGIGILPPRDKSEILKKRLYEEKAIIVLNSIVELNSYLSEYEKFDV